MITDKTQLQFSTCAVLSSGRGLFSGSSVCVCVCVCVCVRESSVAATSAYLSCWYFDKPVYTHWISHACFALLTSHLLPISLGNVRNSRKDLASLEWSTLIRDSLYCPLSTSNSSTSSFFFFFRSSTVMEWSLFILNVDCYCYIQFYTIVHYYVLCYIDLYVVYYFDH